VTIPSRLLTTTCDIFRPFGAASPTATGVACRLVACLERGRGGYASTNYLAWSHYLDVDDTVDVRDGCSRAAGTTLVSYADGDGVRVPSGAGNTTYVVVWVTMVNRGTPVQYKRAYLMRDTPAWPGP
jgi:hypothetical protein